MTQHSTAPNKPSPWVASHTRRVTGLVTALDLACGSGRHGRYLLELGYQVTLLDRDLSGVVDLEGVEAAELAEADLEGGAGWPLGQRQFDLVLVTNYLHRPLFPALLNSVGAGGTLLYETFALGNEKYGRPRNPEFLLRPGELQELVLSAGFVVSAFEQLETAGERPAVIQHIVARKPPA